MYIHCLEYHYSVHCVHIHCAYEIVWLSCFLVCPPMQCTEPHGIANSHYDAAGDDELSFMVSQVDMCMCVCVRVCECVCVCVHIMHVK